MFDVYRKMPKPSSERFLRSEAGDNSSESCGSKVEVEAGNFKSTCEPAPFIFHKGKVYTVEVNPIAMMSECENIQADLDDMLKHQTPTSPHPEKEHRQTVNHKVPNGSFHDLGNANQSLMGGDVHQMQHHDLESADLFPQDVDGNLDQKSLGLDEIDKLFQKFTNHGLDVHAFQAAQESGIIEIASNILDEAQKLQEDGLPSTVLINLTEDDSNHHDEHQKNKIFDPPEESPNSMASPDSKEYVTTAIRGKIDELIWMRKEMPAHPMFFDPSLEIFRSWVGAAAGEEPMPVHEVMQQGVDGFSRRIERNTDDKIFDDKLRPDLLMTILGSLLGYGSESGDEHAPEINDAVDGREHVLEDGSPRNILQETAEDPNTSAGKAPVLITRPLVAAPFVNTRKSVGKEPELPITKSVTAASVGNSGSRYSHVDPNLLGGQRYLKNHNFENKCAIKRAFGAAKPTNLPFHGFTFSGVSSADGIVIEEGKSSMVVAPIIDWTASLQFV